MKLKKEESQEAQKMMKTLSYMYSASLAEYSGTGDRDQKLGNIFLCENILRTSEIELPSYSVDYHTIVCIYCGVGGHSAHQTNRWSTILSAIGVGKPSRT